MNAIETLKKYQGQNTRPKLNISKLDDTHCFDLAIFNGRNWDTYTGYGRYEKDPNLGAIYTLNHAPTEKSFDLIAAILDREADRDDGIDTADSLADIKIEL